MSSKMSRTVDEGGTGNPFSKKAKLDNGSKTTAHDIPSSVIVNFTNNDNERAGPPVDIPVHSTTKQVEALINALLENQESVPYAFYINGVEVTNTISETLLQLQSGDGDERITSFEDTLNVYYQPLSLYRVRPVTRCVETMPGHTDAVLHVSYR